MICFLKDNDILFFKRLIYFSGIGGILLGREIIVGIWKIDGNRWGREGYIWEDGIFWEDGEVWEEWGFELEWVYVFSLRKLG